MSFCTGRTKLDVAVLTILVTRAPSRKLVSALEVWIQLSSERIGGARLHNSFLKTMKKLCVRPDPARRGCPHVLFLAANKHRRMSPWAADVVEWHANIFSMRGSRHLVEGGCRVGAKCSRRSQGGAPVLGSLVCRQRKAAQYHFRNERILCPCRVSSPRCFP